MVAGFCDIIVLSGVFKLRESEFRNFLESSEKITSKEKAVNSRVSRANIVEDILGENLDYIVKDDKKMYKALLQIKESPREKNGNLQNALRWYYQFVNGKKFPGLIAYGKKL